jgi:Kef-type K+ transport system membrane component KefB
MSPTLAFLLLLAMIILAAKAGGLVSTWLGQPAVLGELLAGLLLGPTALDLLHLPAFASGHLDETVFQLAEVGVIFLMFMAGLEVDLTEMMRAGRVAVVAGVLGVITPWVLGAITAWLFGFPLVTSLFVGIILTATSVSISAQTLMELGVLRSREGIALLGAAVIDDILVLLCLSLFLAVAGGTGGGATWGLAGVVFQVIAYLVIATAIGARLIDPLIQRAADLPVSEGLLAAVVVVTLIFAWGAEALGGLAAITGAFLAGLFFARTPLKHTIENGMHTLAYTLFVPVFFVSIGLEANARALGLEGIWFLVAICVVAIVAKIVGCGLGARWAGFSNGEALRLGIGMVSRGEVGLIVAGVGLANALITEAVFTTMIVMVLVTTLVTPVMLRVAFAQVAPPPARPSPMRRATSNVEQE